MKRLLGLLLLLALAACTNLSATPSGTASAGTAVVPAGSHEGAALSPTAMPVLTSTVAPDAPTGAATVVPLLTRTPQPSGSGSEPVTPTLSAKPSGSAPGENVVILARGLTSPDDLAQAPDGSIYLTDTSDGALLRYVSGAAPSVIATGLSIPEGILVLPGGDLIIVEQGKDQLVRYDPASRQVTPFLALRNNTGSAGVDGIVLDSSDPAGPSLLVPDSPNGTLLRVSLDGSRVRQIARGFVRPVAAWVEKDGSILVADEFGDALKRVRPDGKIETVARLPQPDDVIVDSAGNIYVSCLVDGAVHRIAAGTGADSVVVRGLGQPQGIAFDTQGNLLVTDPGNHRLVRITVR
jgi:sugar lactone lactonase YvrE